MGGAGADRRALREREAEPRDERVHIRRGRRQKERGELVAADPPCDIRLPERGGEGRRERAQQAVALLMAVAVVRLLEAVEVEDDESEAAAEAAGARGLYRELRVERAMVEEPGEGIPSRALGELAGDAPDVPDQAALHRRPGLAFAVPLQHPAENEQLGRDLGRSQP